MRHPLAVWTGVAVGVAALDVACDRNDIPGDTLSETVRWLFRVDHPDPRVAWAGRVAFAGAWAALTGWVVPHIWHLSNDVRRSVT